MENVQFQNTQLNTAFSPIEVSNPVQAMQAEQSRQLQAEQSILSDMERNDRVREQNAGQFGKDLEALGKFSSTLTDFINKEYIRQSSQQRKDAFVDELLNPTPASPDFVQGEAEAEKAYGESQQIAEGIGKVDYVAATPFRNESVYAQMGRAEARGLTAIRTRLQGYIVEKTQGMTFKDPAERNQYIASEVMGDFAEEYGLTQLRSSFLEKNILPESRAILNNDAARYRQSWIQKDGANRKADITREVNAGLSTSQAIAALSALPDKYGFSQGRAAAWDSYIGILSGSVIDKTMPLQKYQSIKNNVIPAGQPGAGKTYGEFYRARFNAADKLIAEAKRKESKEYYEDKELAFKDLSEQNLARLKADDDPTDAEIDAMQAENVRIFGKEDPALTKFKRQTVTAEDRNALKETLDSLSYTNSLTPAFVAAIPDKTLRDTYMPIAQQQANARAEAGDYKDQYKQLEAAIKGIPKVKVGPEGKLSFSNLQYLSSLEKKFDAEMAKSIAAGDGRTPDQVASDIAVTVTDDKFDKQGRAKAFLPKRFSPDAKQIAARAQIDEIDILTRTKLLIPELEDPESNIITAAEVDVQNQTLAQMAQNPKIRYIANKIKKPPIDVIARRRNVLGLPDIPEIKQVFEYRNEIDPEMRSYLDKYPSHHTSIRAMGSTGTFKPETIPNGYGDLIQKAASANGINPAILAGLIEQESRWNPRAVSSANAKGLAQFIDSTAAEFGVNPFDPASAIDGAARYLKYLIDYFQGDLKKAIYAYNGGMGNIERLGVGFNSENADYYPGVMQRAYKYGYGEIPVRPSFETKLNND